MSGWIGRSPAMLAAMLSLSAGVWQAHPMKRYVELERTPEDVQRRKIEAAESKRERRRLKRLAQEQGA